MGWLNALGAAVATFGPVGTIFAMVVYPRPYRVILSLSSAFAFALCVMASGLVWTIIPPLRQQLAVLAVYSTAIQELGRFGMYVAYVRLQKTIATMRGISSHSLDFAASPAHAFMERVACATAIGVGTGATHALLITGRQLSDASSPGSSYVPGCAMSQYGLGALVALAFALLHVVWTIYAFVDAYPRQSKAGVGLVAGSHLAASGITLLHAVDGRPALQCGGLTLPLLYVVLIALCAATARSALSTLRKQGRAGGIS